MPSSRDRRKADAALQIQTTEDVIAQGVDALLVVPHQVTPMEPVHQEGHGPGDRGHHPRGIGRGERAL